MRRLALFVAIIASLVLGACGGEEAQPPVTDGPLPTPTMSEEAKTAALEAEMAASLATLGAETAPDAPIGGVLNSLYGMIALNLTKAGFSCAGDGPGATCTQAGGSGAFTVTMNGDAGSMSPNEIIMTTSGTSSALYADMAAAVAHTVLFDPAERADATKFLAGPGGIVTIGRAVLGSHLVGSDAFRLRITTP